MQYDKVELMLALQFFLRSVLRPKLCWLVLESGSAQALMAVVI